MPASEDNAREAETERSPVRRFGLLSLSRKELLPLLPLAIVGRAVTALSSVSAIAAPSGRIASWLGRFLSVCISRPPVRDMIDSDDAARCKRGRVFVW